MHVYGVFETLLVVRICACAITEESRNPATPRDLDSASRHSFDSGPDSDSMISGLMAAKANKVSI